MITFTSNAVLYLLFYILYSIFVVSSLRKQNGTGFLDKSQTDIMKGIFIIIIIAHHFTQRMADPELLRPFLYVGYLAVAGFFLFSGYGMTTSFLKKPNYLKNFFFNKTLLRIYFPAVIAFFVIGLVSNAFNYQENSLVQLLISAFSLTNPTNGKINWFVIATVIFYFNFYISFSLFTTKKAVISTFILNGCYVLIGFYLSLGLWWVNTAFAFPIGVLTAYKKDNVVKLLNRYNWSIFFTMAFLFVVTFVSQVLIPMSTVSKFVLMTVSVVAFVGLILSFSYNFRFKSTIFTFLGAISYELFLIHSSFFEIFIDGFNLENGLMFLPVIMLIIVVAYCLNKFDSLVINKASLSKFNQRSNLDSKAN